MRPRIRHLTANEVTDDKLARHGLTMRHAEEVRSGQCIVRRQKRRLKFRPDGSLYEQPPRLKLIGPDRSGRLLTFVPEYPDQDGRSHVVTGWFAQNADRTRYRRSSATQ